MSTCAHAIEVEDLELGLATAMRARWLRTHLESCDDCREELAMFRSERAMFVARARVVVAAPPRARRAKVLVHLPRAHLLVAACAVFVIGSSQLPRLSVDASDSHLAERAANARVSITAETFEAPMSTRAVASFVSAEPLASVASIADDLTCSAGVSSDSALACEPIVTCMPFEP